MPRITLLSISAGTAVLVGRDVDGTPIGGLYRPGGARPCPCALLAQTVRLTMSNHGALTRIYYGKFPDSENSNIGREWVISRYWKSRFFLRATKIGRASCMISNTFFVGVI